MGGVPHGMEKGGPPSAVFPSSLHIPIRFPLRHKKGQRNHTGKRLGGRYGPPDPVQAEKQGQDQNRKHLEHQRPQKRDGCRYEAVIQGREEGGGKNVESRQNEGKGKYGKGMPRHLQQLCVIPNENGRQRQGQYLCDEHHQDAGDSHEQQAFAEQAFQFPGVFCAVVISHNGSHPNRISNENRNKNKLDIHQDPICRHAVFTREFEQPDIIQHADKRPRYVRHQLRRAVGTSLQQYPAFRPGLCEAQKAAVGPQEIEERQDPTNALADSGGERGAADPPSKSRHKQGVERHIGDTRGDGGRQAELGFFRRRQKGLKDILQHERRIEQQHHPAVNHAVLDHGVGRSEQIGYRPYEQHADNRQDDPGGQGQLDHHGKIPVGLLPIPFADGFRHQCAAAGPDHKTEPAENHNERHHQINGGKGHLTDEVGHEQPIHHPIYRGEYHHHDRREAESPYFFVRKMV